MSHAAPVWAPTEEQFQQQIITMAKLNGWRCYHTHDSRHSEAGFPDLVMVRKPRLIVAELKRQDGRLRPAQAEWMDLFRAVPGVEVHLWRPSDWPKILETLTREDRCLT